MKKLFFAALLATVAVGGAYAQQYASVPNGPAVKTCSGTTTPLCGASTYLPGTSTQAPISAQISTAIPI